MQELVTAQVTAKETYLWLQCTGRCAVFLTLTGPVMREYSHAAPTAKQTQAVARTPLRLPVKLTTLSGLLPSVFMSASKASLLQLNGNS